MGKRTTLRGASKTGTFTSTVVPLMAVATAPEPTLLDLARTQRTHTARQAAMGVAGREAKEDFIGAPTLRRVPPWHTTGDQVKLFSSRVKIQNTVTRYNQHSE